MRKRVTGWLLAVLVVTGCDAADDVRVQPLPPLETSSPEARAGLPVVSGIWRFAGWELAPRDTARIDADLPGFGELRLETQRLDSIAGFYMAGDARLPVIGEVRRDSVLALAGGGRFLAGRITADTLWLALTSLVESGSWPDDARAAFVRSAAPSRFVRVKGQRPVLAVADSLVRDSALMAAGDTAAPRLAEVAPRRGVTPLAGKPFPSERAQPRVGEPRPRQAEQQPPEPRRAEPLEQAPPAEPQQAQPEPQPVEPEPQQAEPEPEPQRPPPRRRPRLLGVPVDSSAYSPTAARAISRPGEVSASR